MCYFMDYGYKGILWDEIESIRNGGAINDKQISAITDAAIFPADASNSKNMMQQVLQ